MDQLGPLVISHHFGLERGSNPALDRLEIWLENKDGNSTCCVLRVLLVYDI